MSWIYLLVAGILEIVWAVALKHTHGFTRLWPSILVSSAICGSMFFLALAVRTIPIGTGYAIWTSIGIVGATVAGPLVFQQPLRPLQLLFVGLLVISILGLKITASAR